MSEKGAIELETIKTEQEVMKMYKYNQGEFEGAIAAICKMCFSSGFQLLLLLV